MKITQKSPLWRVVILISLLLFPAPSQQGVVSGPGCFFACFNACATMGASKFAEVVGIFFDITGCSAMCGPVCSLNLPIPGVCFAETTTFLNESFQEVNAASIKKGDVIYSLSEGRKIPTTVTNALKIEGGFDFVSIRLINTETNLTTTLTVTEEHGLIVFNNNQSHTIQAKNIVSGNEMIGFDQRKWKIQEIKQLKLPTEYIIQTETGTALASGILTTTSCLH